MWNDNKKQWYALFVQSGQEERVKNILSHKLAGDLCYSVPKRCLRERRLGKWREVKRTLFPGYVLIHCEMTEELYYQMKGTEGLVKLLRDEEAPISIPDEELSFLSDLLDDGVDEIGFSTLYREGDQVVVTEGPLKGMEGHIKKINKRKGRAQVQMTFMGEPRIIELGVEIMSKDE